METYIAGAGGGGKGGGGSARVAQEAPNTLKSKSYARIVDVLCEGEIEGLVGGLQGVYFNDVPLQNSDGSFNYKDVVVETREGTLAQNITKIGSTTENTTSVGTEIKQATPVLYSITNGDVDRARMSIQVPALSSQNTSNGDLNGTSVKLKVEYNPNNTGWIDAPVGSTSINISPTSFTGVSLVSGSLFAESAYTMEEYCVGADDRRCRMVRRYSKSTATIQYQKDAGVWTTIKTVEFTKTLSIPFNFNTVSTSTYSVRVIMSGGAAGSIASLTGSYTSGEVTISGKTTSPYSRDVEFALTGSAPWLIRVTRLTEDSTSSALQNKTYLSSVTSIFEEKFRYPATAYIAVSIDAEQFSSIPSRSYDVKLLKIKVPTNYDPIARTYTGIWDGTFKVEWSDNPAWCFYDLLTNTRYGLGDRLDASQIDKWALYDIAQYCDELVDNGADVLEPRFTCNILIQTREEAYRVLQDMASLFAGITYWGSTSDGFQGVIPVQDKPSTTYSYIFNNTNVVDGVFSYQTANVNTQYNAVYVTYNEPEDNYKQKVVYVSDDDAIAADGFVNDTNIVAFGCTSRAQATRLGRRILYSNRYENDVVSFSVGNEGVVPTIGSIIKISDELRGGERRGGRVVSSPTTSSVELDAPFTLDSGITYKITLVGYDASVSEHTVTNVAGTYTTLSFTPAATSLSKNAAYIISDTGLQAALFKVVAVTESDKNLYAISAVSHNPTKYGYIDDLTPLVFSDTTNPSLALPPTNLTLVESLYVDGNSVRPRVTLSWTAPNLASYYTVSWQNTDQTVVGEVTVRNPSVDIDELSEGIYTFSVTSFDLLGAPRGTSQLTTEVYGLSAPPSTVEGFTASALSNSAVLTWNLQKELDVQVGGTIVIRHTSDTLTPTWEKGVPVAIVSGAQTTANVSLLRGTYMAKARDSAGNFSLNAAYALSEFAQIEELNVVETITEHPTWTGVKVNVVLDEQEISLQPLGQIDSVVLIDDIVDWNTLDLDVASSGTYFFDNEIDLGSVMTSRLTAEIVSRAVNIDDTIDLRTDFIDTWEDIDGGIINDAVATLFVRTTNDDPLGSPTWGAWKEFLVNDYTARAYQFKIELTTQNPRHNIYVSQVTVSLDMPDRVEGDNNIVCPPAGYSVVFGKAFHTTPAIAINIDDMQQGDYYEISSKTRSGFTIIIKDLNGIAVIRQFDWIAKGYGYETII